MNNMKWHDARKEWPENDEHEILAYFDADYYKVVSLHENYDTKELEPWCCCYPTLPREYIICWCYVKDMPKPK